MFWSYSSPPPSAADCTTFADAIEAAWSAHMASLMCSNYSMAGVKVTDLSSDTGAQGVNATNVPGTRADSSNPVSVTSLIEHSISRRYRGGHPRSYWPVGGDPDREGNQTWLPAYITEANAKYAAFVAALASTAYGALLIEKHVSVHYFSGATYQPVGLLGRTRRVPTPLVPPTVDIITLSTFSNTFGSQRRRLRES
jgi:hypothetical protein